VRALVLGGAGLQGSGGARELAKKDEIKESIEPVYDDRQQFVCSKTTVQTITDGEARIEMEIRAFVDAKMETVDTVAIEGVPPIDMVIKPYIGSADGTANALVNAIPHVMNAEPSIVTAADLPIIFGVENDVRLFLK